MVPLSITISILWNGTYICTVIFILLLYYGTLIHNHIYTMVPLSITIYILWYPYLYYIMVTISMPISILYCRYLNPYLSMVLIFILYYGTHIYLWYSYLYYASNICTVLPLSIPISILWYPYRYSQH